MPTRPVRRVDGREGVALVVLDPEHRQVVGRAHVLGLLSDGEGLDDLVGGRVDDADRVAPGVRDIDARRVAWTDGEIMLAPS